ncbi:MAG: helix-turn-helix domain-containing protein [Planktothrix sp.]
MQVILTYQNLRFKTELSIGRLINARRNTLGLSFEQLAGMVNISRRTLFRYCHSSEIPPIEALLALCRVLDIKMEG